MKTIKVINNDTTLIGLTVSNKKPTKIKKPRRSFEQKVADIIVAIVPNIINKALEPIHAKLDEHTRILEEHTRTLNEHSRILEEHTKLLIKHSKILEKHSDTLKKYGLIFKKHNLD